MSRVFILLFTANAAMAEVVPTLPKSVDRVLPEDSEFSKDTGYKKLYNDLKPKLDELQRQSDSARTTLKGSAAEPAQVSAPDESEPPRQLPRRTKVSQPPRIDPLQVTAPVMPATVALTFGVSAEAALDETTTVLPAGSFVKARVVSGVEANTLEPYPVLLQLEYAFTGPNKTKIDLSNCFMIAKARANLSTERVIMETDTMSCVRENGEHFKSAARGYTAGEDSTFGSTGTFISKQGQVLLAAVLASVAKNAGEAVALAQQTTTVVGADRAQSATNVTGDQAKFIAGRSVVDGATLIAQWYLDYAKQLVPSIGIGSGQTVHVIMLDTIRVPTLKD
jgi:conjugal transfer pilus assembly protein TraB